MFLNGLFDLFDFSIDGTVFNLFKTPFEYFRQNISLVFDAIDNMQYPNPQYFQYVDRNIWGLLVTCIMGLAFFIFVVFLSYKMIIRIASLFSMFSRSVR